MAKHWKILCLLLALVMVLSILAGCKKKEEEEEEEPATTETIDLAEYTVVRPENKSDGAMSTFLSEELKSFLASVQELTGAETKAVGDENSPGDSEAKEILIGQTSRAESATAIAELPGEHAFAVRKIGNKLVIVGHTQELVAKGMNYLLETYVSKSEKDGTFEIDLELNYSKELFYHEIVTDSIPQYELLTSITANGSITDAAELVFLQINRNTEQEPLKGVDNANSYGGKEAMENLPAIVVGPTEFDRTKELMAEADYFSWAFETNHKQIYLFGADNKAIKAVCDYMVLLIDAAIIKTDDGVTVRISKDDPIVGSGAEWSNQIPRYAAGKDEEDRHLLDSVEEFQENYFRLYYTKTDIDTYNEYNAKVVDAGYSLYSENELGDNVYKTYKSETLMLHTYFLKNNMKAAESTVSVIVTPLENFVDYPLSAESDKKVTAPSMGLACMEYTKMTSTGGAGFVYTLADGSYVIIDGGFGAMYKDVEVPKVDENGDPVLDADGKQIKEKKKEMYYEGHSGQLYDYLADNNKREDGEILIRAWIITNANSDQYGCFADFATNFADEVTLEYFVAQFDYDKQIKGTTTGVANGNGAHVDKIMAAMREFDGVEHIVPLVGQKMYFGEFGLDFLYTAEMLCHLNPENVGDHSLVFKAYFAGHTFLHTSDIGLDALDKITAHYRSNVLKSDFVQAPEHGQIGSRQFWNYASPTYLIINNTKQKADIAVGSNGAYIAYAMGMKDDDGNAVIKAVFDGQSKFIFETAKFPFTYIPGDPTFGNGNYDTDQDTGSWGDLTENEIVGPSEDHQPGDYDENKDSTSWEDMVSPTAA